jgi:hypothetical protein
MGGVPQRPRPPRSRDETRRRAFGPRRRNPPPGWEKPRAVSPSQCPSARDRASSINGLYSRPSSQPQGRAVAADLQKGIDPGIAAEGGKSRNRRGREVAESRRVLGRLHRRPAAHSHRAASAGSRRLRNVSRVGHRCQHCPYIRTAPAVALSAAAFLRVDQPGSRAASGAFTRTVVARPTQAPSRRSRSGRLRPFRHGGNWLRSRFSSLVWRSSRRW